MKRLILVAILAVMLSGCAESFLLLRVIRGCDWYRGCQLEPVPCHIAMNTKGGIKNGE